MTVHARFGFPLEYVSDVEAVKDFYVQTLGVEVERYHPTFVQFRDSGGNNFAIASDQSLGGKGETELYWLIEDAEAAYRDLSQTAEIGLPLQQLPFGKVFSIKDPAGHFAYLIELATNRPSQEVGGSNERA